jgi:lysophospholipase L1-like esterase
MKRIWIFVAVLSLLICGICWGQYTQHDRWNPYSQSKKGTVAFSPNQLPNLQLWLDPSKGTYQDTGLSTHATTQGATVNGWADQSGNGNNATYSSGGTLQLGANGINSKPALSFMSGNKLVTSSFLASNQATTVYLVVTAPPSSTVETAITNGSDFQSYFSATTNVSPQKWATVNPTNTHWISPPATRNVHIMMAKWDGTFRLTGLDNYVYMDYSSENSGLTGALTIARPAVTNSYNWPALIGDLLVYNAAHTPTQMAKVCNYLWTKYGQASLYTLPNLAFEGNSWVSEYVASGSEWEGVNGTPSDVIQGLGSNYNFTKIGVLGRNITTMTSQAPTEIDPSIMAGTTNVIAGWEIVNQCSGSTAAQTYADLQAWATARKAAGWNKVVIVDSLPNPNSTVETCREGVNAYLAADFPTATSHSNVYSAGAGVTYADYMVQVSQDATMGYGPTANCTGNGVPWSCCTGSGTSSCTTSTGANYNGTYYQTDNIHPNVAGSAILAPYIQNGFKAALGQ